MFFLSPPKLRGLIAARSPSTLRPAASLPADLAIQKGKAMAFGKISDRFFIERILPHLGAHRDDVLVGPWLGTDAAILRQADNRVMVVAEDPIFLVPGVTIEDFGWYTVHIGASDVAVTGVPPTHLTYS